MLRNKSVFEYLHLPSLSPDASPPLQLGAIRSEADAVSDELKKTREMYGKARAKIGVLERELSGLNSRDRKAAGDQEIDHQVRHDTRP